MKVVNRFREKGKLSPQFVEPFKILERVGLVTYHLALSQNLIGTYDICRVSILRTYVIDPTHILDSEPFQICPNLSYEETSIRILDKKDEVLCCKSIPLVKIMNNNTMKKISL